MTQQKCDDLLDTLSPNALASFPWLFQFWGRVNDQLEPSGDWTTWIILGGRGSGKTRAGGEWIRSQVEGATPLSPGRMKRIALIGETTDQAREIMVLGESGILPSTPADRRPSFCTSRKKLIWPNGAEAQLFSARDPESLRGPQFDCAWLDELGKWKKAGQAWDMLQFSLRLGNKPRQIITTTPRANPTLLQIIQAKSTIMTSAPTWENRENLAKDFLEKITKRYEGTTLGRQELGGELLLELPGALWSREIIERCRISGSSVPELQRIVIAVDPPITSHSDSDECGIIVAGIDASGAPFEWVAYVLADLSVRGRSPSVWAERVVSAFHQYKADRVVAEINQGGDMVEEIIRQNDPNIPFKGVIAKRGKVLRAEPVSALYEQNRVRHTLPFKELEDQMCTFSAHGIHRGIGSSRSPDRADALVWAITDLLISGGRHIPKIRRLQFGG
jgi:phage terminase large subunit-like protein